MAEEEAQEEVLEELFIAEERDAAARGPGAAAQKKEEEHAAGGAQAAARGEPRRDARPGDRGPEDTGDTRGAVGVSGGTEEEEEGEEGTLSGPRPDLDQLSPPGGEEEEEEDLRKARRLTPDFPEALYELLCTLQEGRRLNDQRCSFRLEGGVPRRRCHSEPNTNKPAHRVVFSSMTSLQREEFFELVATSQARRLDDQRAPLAASLPPKSKSRSIRGSFKSLALARKPAATAAAGAAPMPAAAAAAAPKEDLYNMILTTQAQGRLEDQRSRAPGPMDDEDFFSLLLKVQGGRMDEQRTQLPRLLQT